MPIQEKRKELIVQIVLRIKEVIADLSDEEVRKMMEDAGEQTSITTIRRIRTATGEQLSSFNYNLTIKPFARVFLGLSDKPVHVSPTESEQEKNRAAVDNINQLKNIENEMLRKENETWQTLVDTLKAQLEENKASEQRKISHLQKQIDTQNLILGDRKGFMDERRDLILRMEQEKKDLVAKHEAEIEKMIAKYEAERKDLVAKYEAAEKATEQKHKEEVERLRKNNNIQGALLILAVLVLFIAFGTDAIIPLF